jgi:ureidoglycolate hydrolase
MMDKKLLQIEAYDGIGYKPLIDFGTWRVAYLRFIDELIPENIHRLERHVETDEVFVLLSGQAVLFIGDGDAEIEKLYYEVMQPNKLYNVSQNVWHACVLSRDATILLVENRDTGFENTDYIDLNKKHGELVKKISSSHILDWRK